jgi:hypothetical protein
MAGKPWALPSSRDTPVCTCPVLGPRWCPSLLALAQGRTAAFRCGDSVGFPSPSGGEDILSTTTTSISGFHTTACALTAPGFEHFITEMHAGSLRTCWLGVGPVGLASYLAHRLGTTSKFQNLLSSPCFGFILARPRTDPYGRLSRIRFLPQVMTPTQTRG